MIKAVIFDMDGVLVNTEHTYMDLMRKNLNAVNADFEEELLHSFVGSSDPVMMKTLDPIVGHACTGKEFIERLNEEIELTPPNFKELMMDGVYEAMTHFKSRGYKIGLASSSPRDIIEQSLNSMEIMNYFDTTSSGHEYKVSKPNPEIYLHTLEKLGVKPEECIVIEDSEWGIKAAKAAGIYVIAIRDQHFGMYQDDADIIVDSLFDAIEVANERERNG